MTKHARLASGLVVTYADVSMCARLVRTGLWQRQVEVERTRSVIVLSLGELTRNDVTPCWRESGQGNDASGRLQVVCERVRI